jgi:3-deoxy-D-arabino-heptulosonate 7-phosphate (DAHP) synthase class II
MADLGQTADIDTTIAALQQGVTAIPVEQAIAVLESWQQQLQGLAIADDLGELKQALQKQKSAEAIANLLIDLGGDTAEELAIETSEDVTAKIRQLASLLTQAGNALRG